VCFGGVEISKLLNEKPIPKYLMTPSITIDSICVFKAYIGFIVEPDSSITNKMIYDHSVNCKELGLVYTGQEINIYMETRIF
jgi:hypothetical protein